ncbi:MULTISPECIES: hypothetical protein [Streptomyces]|uniref:N,N-dimethylformamidase alpha subunit domain-containing protein n=1 Tax=Streptomyces mordarskii TaxID=1226758 RepID=A0ABP3M8Q8_9ACTN|nr:MULTISPECIES: hypothetical protein [Streptomyces]QTI88288.1 hypothetical protein AS97_46740 [Streptomyces sp. AgN23]RSS45086.1 hypothetical protein EF902_14830 [Streptomyces sp. WAC05858]WTA80598.1 hypothetical protein OG751_12135 [Streptomyces antimycoticus]WTB09197.1 hypothetical protein OG546_36350 [Streptomyces antimycoticus]
MTQPPPRTLAEEFRADPLGRHSPPLQRLLYLFRGSPLEGKYALVHGENAGTLLLAQLSGRRDKGITVLPDQRFHSRAEAEWEVFCRRWKQFFGEELDREGQ